MAAQQATKAQITRIAREVCPEGKWGVAAQGTTQRITYTARQRGGLAIEDRHATRLQQNGRYRVTFWGKDVDARVRRLTAALIANGYIVENVSLDSFETHAGIVLPLEGVLRFEGTY